VLVGVSVVVDVGIGVVVCVAIGCNVTVLIELGVSAISVFGNCSGREETRTHAEFKVKNIAIVSIQQ